MCVSWSAIWESVTKSKARLVASGHKQKSVESLKKWKVKKWKSRLLINNFLGYVDSGLYCTYV